MKKISISRNPNSIHIEKLNDITKQILISSRFLQSRQNNSKEKSNSNNLNYNIDNANSNYITPNIKEKMLNMYSELSFKQNPLSTRINEYNSFSTENNNQIINKQKGQSLDKKKEEIMHLLKPNNDILINKSQKLKKIQKMKKKPKINLNNIFQKTKHINLKFSERMKSELDKILYKNENISDENKNNLSKEKNETKLKSKINQSLNNNNSYKTKSISYTNNSLYLINQLKTKYGIKI
jgi:hypothetical protein